jgi:hypothetical protein
MCNDHIGFQGSGVIDLIIARIGSILPRAISSHAVKKPVLCRGKTLNFSDKGKIRTFRLSFYSKAEHTLWPGKISCQMNLGQRTEILTNEACDNRSGFCPAASY